MKVLVVVDMQNDFINGALGTKEAEAVVPGVVEKIREFDGKIIATRDTHGEDYLESEEGKHLPVVHCVKGTEGWEIRRISAALVMFSSRATVRKYVRTLVSIKHLLLPLYRLPPGGTTEKGNFLRKYGESLTICLSFPEPLN